MANSAGIVPANVTLVWYYPEAFANWQAPTAAELNNLFDWTPATAQGAFGFNLSCAIIDDYTLNQTGSEIDDTRTVCDVGEVANQTYRNYEGSFDFLRDEEVDDESLFNLARELFTAPDRKGFWVKRVGVGNDVPFAIGQDISIFGFNTDLPVDVIEDNALLRHGARFKPTGEIEINFKVDA